MSRCTNNEIRPSFGPLVLEQSKGKKNNLPHPLGIVFSDVLLFGSRDGVVVLHRSHRATQNVDVALDG